MANPSGRSFRVIDTTHLAAVAVLEAEIGAGNELVERPEMAESGPSILWILGHLNVRFGEKRTFRNIPKIFTKLTNLERPLYAKKRTFG